jgi:preprotein translocase SecE subunit
MAVAVKNTPETSTRPRLDRLALTSLVGALYVLGSLGVVGYGVPRLWTAVAAPTLAATLGSFVEFALLALVLLAAAVFLIFLGTRLIGPEPPRGARAGIFVCSVGLLAIALVTCWVGTGLQHWLANEALGQGLTAAVGLGLLFLAGRALLRSRLNKPFVQLEDQGWFTTTAYKWSQGQRVRRGTILGILILAGCGVYTLLAHRTLGSGSENNWVLAIPFTGRAVTLLPDIQFTVPIVLVLASLWFAYRVVNFPTFADFLIATEAEINKVSWTTGRRLVQDTIVVLVTVFLMTVFLFVVDIAWAKLLSLVGVLRFEQPAAGSVSE